MRDVYKEYKQGLISWDEAYLIANNNAATMKDTDYWTKQMESLGVDMADCIMKQLGYKENQDGTFYKPIPDNSLSF